jgi:sugar/nucleoside kinase (ribokinase family)
VVGDVLLDVDVAAGEIRPGGATHGKVAVRPGGSGTNAAVWAVSRGAGAWLHGRVGGDASGELIATALERRGVEGRLVVDAETPTGTAVVLRDGRRRSIVADPGASGRLRPEDLPDRLVAASLLVSGYLLLQETSEPAARAALERSAASHVAVDAASADLLSAFGREEFFEATREVTLLLGGPGEARFLTGRSGREAARRLSARYPVVVVRQGRRGALLAREGLVTHAPAPRVRERDPLGAGDAFAGVLLGALALGRSPETAVREACRAGAEAVTLEGTWPG